MIDSDIVGSGGNQSGESSVDKVLKNNLDVCLHHFCPVDFYQPDFLPLGLGCNVKQELCSWMGDFL